MALPKNLPEDSDVNIPNEVTKRAIEEALNDENIKEYKDFEELKKDLLDD